MMPGGTVKRLYARNSKGKPLNVKLGGKAAPRRAADGRQVPKATIRCSQIERLFVDRYGATLPDDDAGRDDAEIMLNHIGRKQVGDREWLMNDWLERWAPFIKGEERDDMIRKALLNPKRYRADVLGRKLGLTYAVRERLGLTMIGCIDVNAEQREEIQKVKDKKRKAKRRRDAGRMTREEYEGNSLSKIQPWKTAGVSRSTWYRRQGNSQYAAEQLVSSIARVVVTVSLD